MATGSAQAGLLCSLTGDPGICALGKALRDNAEAQRRHYEEMRRRGFQDQPVAPYVPYVDPPINTPHNCYITPMGAGAGPAGSFAYQQHCN